MPRLSPSTNGSTRGLGLPGMTLVEMLVAMTATLIMMGIVSQIFATLGQGVNGSRNQAELSDRMRATAYRLRQDLTGVTVDPQPSIDPARNLGYFELVEGPNTDLDAYYAMNVDGVVVSTMPSASQPFRKWKDDAQQPAQWYTTRVGSDDRIVGDTDDALLFTTQTTADPFSGRLDTRLVGGQAQGGGIRSPYAEVVWFCRRTANTADPGMYTLHRRQRLVMAHPGAEPFVNTQQDGAPTDANGDGMPPNTLVFTDWTSLFNMTDVCCRLQNDGNKLLAVPNCLGDLTKRESRFLHNPNFPHRFDSTSNDLTLSGNRFGEDVILTNVIAFDVRVLDPGAPVQVVGNTTVCPGDPGYTANNAALKVIDGAYVDLGYGINGDLPYPNAPSLFHGFGDQKSQLRAGSSADARTYCTWSTHYEYNGLDDDNDTNPDEGTNGQDDNNNGLTDEAAEAETAPPYPFRLPGLEVRIRCYEPSSRQIRQITVRHSFVQ